MFDSFRRAKLQREGLSCGRKRRKHQKGEITDWLRTNPAAAALLFAFFFIGVGFFMRLGTKVTDGLVPPGLMIYTCAGAVLTAMVIHLRVVLRDLVTDNQRLTLVLGALLVHLGLVVMVLDYAFAEEWSRALAVMTLPHIVAPMLLSVLMGRKVGLFAAIYATLLGVLIAVAVNPFTYTAASILLGFLGVAATRHVRKRNHLFMAGLYAGTVAALFSLLLHHASGMEGTSVGRVLGLPFVSSMVAALLVSGLLPMLETVFGITTDISWLEQADLNHPLMRRLSIEAPGTYHHSLMVAALSESAAEKVAANPTKCRVCSYFHDIGKLTKPEYFIENMDPDHNPHDDLTPRMSALVLIAHVKDGVDLAIQHKLNGQMIDVIEQHHGTSLAGFFYRRALDQRAEMLRMVEESRAKEEDVPQVSEDVFRYPGPKPQSKEAAIISLADAVESASRTLDKPNASRIETLINTIVQSRVADGQLDECDLTIAELARVKASFGKTLLGMMHGRIKYNLSHESATSRQEVAGGSASGAGDPPTLVLDGGFSQRPRKKETEKERPSGNPASAA
ncbi:MAG: HDIG domain-containing protein [Verrucomicrobiales bacterium]|nr:HDIG domain-containing protein [Verrucomicrobiales bacterium]